MITFPNAKINLGLSVVEKRPDGYHNLETVFYPVPWEDALEIIENPQRRDSKCVLMLSGKSITEPHENLVVKAYNILDRDYALPGIDIYLYKNIPLAAGLGGGSSDAAFMLKALNTKFDLNLSDKQLENYASGLGADCAFFIKNRPVFAEGIGNIFTPLELSLKDYHIVIIKPDIFISTKDAYSQIKAQKPLCSIKDIIFQPVDTWKDHLVNDFEASVFSKYPLIRELKQHLYDNGAVYASMSGSGSAVYGIFEPGCNLPEIKKEGMEFVCGTFNR